MAVQPLTVAILAQGTKSGDALCAALFSSRGDPDPPSALSGFVPLRGSRDQLSSRQHTSMGYTSAQYTPAHFHGMHFRTMHARISCFVQFVGLRAYAGDRYQKFCCGSRGAPRPGGSHKLPSACGLLTTTRGVCMITPQRQPGKFNQRRARYPTTRAVSRRTSGDSRNAPLASTRT